MNIKKVSDVVNIAPIPRIIEYLLSPLPIIKLYTHGVILVGQVGHLLFINSDKDDELDESEEEGEED